MEIQQLALDEVLFNKRDKTILGKMGNLFRGKKKREYTHEQKERIDELGGWICTKCQYPNSTIENIICEDCGNKETS